MLRGIRRTTVHHGRYRRSFSSAAINHQIDKKTNEAFRRLNDSGLKKSTKRRNAIEESEDVTAKQAQSNKLVDKGKLYDSVANLLNNPSIKSIIQKESVVKTFGEIIEDEKVSYGKTIKLPTSTWLKKVKSIIGGRLGRDVTDEPLLLLMSESYGHPKEKLCSSEVFLPLNVGDAVELSTSLDQAGMSVIVEVPSRSDDARYTVMNTKGELSYFEKSAFTFRIPGLIPGEWMKGVVEKTNIDSPGYGSIKTTVNQQFETYFVNPLARRLIVTPVLKITLESWSMLPEVSKKLELLHRILQGRGPKQVSLFVLAAAVKSINLEQIKSDIEEGSAQEEYLKLSRKLHDSIGPEFSLHQPANLGKDISELNDNEEVQLSLLYAVVLALRKQKRLWSTNYSSRSALLPLSITVNPLEYVHKVNLAVESLKNDPELTKAFISFVEMKDFKEIPSGLENVLFLLKEYSVRNINDPIAETVICQLLKRIESTDTTDISRTHVYDLLTEVGYISNISTNPEHFSSLLSIPGKDVSVKSDLEQEYFDNVPISENDIPDISASIRKDFGDMKVYCIDGETAHEIDDGVSIERIDDENVILHAHIADPSSYLTPDDVISKIAFERASTIYQPELVSPMLPKALADLCGLGINGRKTRAMTFSIPFNFETGANLNEAKVQPSYVSNFPKYTYDTVDEVLRNTKHCSYESLNDEERDLNDLFRAAKTLFKNRIKNGAVVFGEGLSTRASLLEKGSIKPTTAIIDDALIDETLDEGSDVLFAKEELTDSVTLVSELMILANSVGAKVMSDQDMPGIYRAMKTLPVRGTAATAVKSLNKMILSDSKLPSMSDVFRCFKFISAAYYSPTPFPHLMLGIDQYLPSTSPLRRYGDLINHWQFHNYLNFGKPRFDLSQMNYIALHIEVKNDMIKAASNRSNSYYVLNYIRNQLRAGNSLKLSFSVWTRPSGENFVHGTIKEFGVPAHIHLSSKNEPPMIGQVIKKFNVVAVDPVDGNLILEQFH